MSIPDGTVWTGRYPVAPGTEPCEVVVRVRGQGYSGIEFDIEHSYGGPRGIGHGSLPAPVFARRFNRIY
jgi:hypothetical protein